MKIHQLFREKMPEDIAVRLIKCYGLTGMKDYTMFNKEDLIKQETVVKVTRFVEELRYYYLPCKARIYLVDLDEMKCITILRQVLRLFDLNLCSIQKYVNYKKITFYFISPSLEPKKHIQFSQKPVTIEFN